MTLHPVSSTIPLEGSARVEPQIEQEITVDALSKIVDSFPQSLHPTFKNLPLIISLIY